MDNPTERLVATLRERDRLRQRLAGNDRQLAADLRVWAESRPGAVRGAATEPGARFLLRQAGLL